MKQHLATTMSILLLMIILARADEARAQKIKERLENKSAVEDKDRRGALATATARRPRHASPSARARRRRFSLSVASAAARHKVDARTLWAVARLERRLRLSKNFPTIDATARRLHHLARRYDDRLDLILASYHAGEKAVDAYLQGSAISLPHGRIINRRKLKTDGIPPYQPTQTFVADGLRLYERAFRLNLFEPTRIAGAPYRRGAQQTRPRLAFAKSQTPIIIDAAGATACAEKDIAATTRRRNVRPQLSWKSNVLPEEDLFRDLHSGERYIIREESETKDADGAALFEKSPRPVFRNDPTFVEETYQISDPTQTRPRTVAFNSFAGR